MRHLPLILVVFTLSLFSCSEYNKLLKSNDLDKKYEMAIKYYDKGDYVKTLTLMEELIPLYRGTARAETTMFYYSYANFEMGDYVLAGYHFKNFVRTFPTSIKAEECAYMNAYCYYLNSSSYSLDQEDTKAAIREFQAFVNAYPKSSRIKDCNETLDKLRAKLERKAYEIAKQYYNIGDYKASVVAFGNVMKDYPGTAYTEELSFLTIKSYYMLARNSIESKKEERLNLAIESYVKFADSYPKSEYIREAETIYDNCLKLKNKLSKPQL